MNFSHSKLGRLFWRIVSHYYGVFLFLTICFIAFGFFVLYRDFYLLRQSNPIISLSKIKVEEEVLSEVIEELEERKIKIQEIEDKEYFNPFKEVPLSESESD